MSTSFSFFQYVMNQLIEIKDIYYCKKLGNYTIYKNGIAIAYLYKDQIFINKKDGLNLQEYQFCKEDSQYVIVKDIENKKKLKELFEWIYKMETKELELKKIPEKDMEKAIMLIWDVFLEFEGCDYSKEGLIEFQNTLKETQNKIFYGSYASDELIGVLAIREYQHISYFFVKKEYMNQGIGKRLFYYMSKDYEKKEFTVNSSFYAHDIYKHLGFYDIDKLQCINGIRFIPMKYGGNYVKN